MDGAFLVEFCNSTFWDSSAWNAESPRLTSCFQNTVLVWVPSLLLFLFSGVDIYFSISNKARDIPWNWRNISKFVILGFLVAICIFDFFYYCFVEENSALVDVTTPIIKIVTLLYCAGLVYSHKKCGRQSSGTLFIFWVLTVVFGAVHLHSELEARSNGVESPTQMSFLVYYMLCCGIFLLNFISDLPPTHTEFPKEKNVIPIDSASFPSRLTFHWFDGLAYLGWKRPLVPNDLWALKHTHKSSYVYPMFERHWNKAYYKNLGGKSARFTKNANSVDISKRSKVKTTSILPPLVRMFGVTFLAANTLKLCQDALTFTSPQLLNYLIAFISSDEPVWKGYMYAVLLFVVGTLSTLVTSQLFTINMLIGLRVRTALISAIYRKALRLSNAAKKKSTVGEIVNLMAVDAQKFRDVIIFLPLFWSAPMQIILAMYFLWQILGSSAFTGLAILVLMIPINVAIANKNKQLQLKQMKKKDERVKMMNEVLSGIKVLKLYAWERSFMDIVRNIRDKEIVVLRHCSYFESVTSFIWSCAPFLVTLATFAVYVLIDDRNNLDAQKAFVSLSLFNILRMPLTLLPNVISGLIQASVSVKRINTFLNSEEIDPSCVAHDENESDPLVMEKGSFSWGVDEELTLKDINLRVKKGSLVAVVGAVGSGKSSLISAFLGEMDKTQGKVNVKGSVAYASQQAWIQNATLKDNILFGNPSNNHNYTKVIEACALKHDLDILPGGDYTEIGEKGINLSGGQKQRVSLARAVYSDCDIYFLDDPLSAVDSHVGKHIFENVISSKGLLRKKTRIFVTHSISFLPEVDEIVVLTDGTISEVGTYRELLARKGAFSEFLTTHLLEGEHEDIDELDSALKEEILKSNPELKRQLSRQKSVASLSSSNTSLSQRKTSISQQSTKEDKPPEKKGQRLIEDEKTEVGRVKWAVFKHYLSSIGVFISLTSILLCVITQMLAIGSNLWLTQWASDKNIMVNGTQDTALRDKYLSVYGLFGFGQTVLVLIYTLCWYLGCLAASKRIHSELLSQTIHAPMSFFDTTQLGRILNRFSSEMNTVDNVIPMTFRQFFSLLLGIGGILFLISYSTPIFLVVLAPISIIYVFIQRFFAATSRQLRRLESVTRSPIYSHFTESLTGTPIIRAYHAQSRFIQEYEEKVDSNQICTYPGQISNRWLAVRLETIGNLIVFFAALFGVLEKDSLDPALIGLSVSYAMSITMGLNWLVRTSAEIETNIVSVERIKEYMEAPQEAPWEITPNPVGKDWPEEGIVEFRDYKVRYREGLDLVLKGINVYIKGGEKVGIVGRTGAGKSSLTLCLFRIIEAASGKILIDGVDISKLGLQALRSRITIIPQDPVLFSGTLRLNLDPFEQYSDEQIWHALELAHLKSYVVGLTAGLQHFVSEGGENLSIGQRQLICLARALLRKTKVLVLDEATAAVDLETDDLIQETIRSEFKHCTVLTIAHRLNTIMDSDRVLVLDKGEVVEFEPPGLLLKKPSSIFYGMAKDAGLV